MAAGLTCARGSQRRCAPRPSDSRCLRFRRKCQSRCACITPLVSGNRAPHCAHRSVKCDTGRDVILSNIMLIYIVGLITARRGTHVFISSDSSRIFMFRIISSYFCRLELGLSLNGSLSGVRGVLFRPLLLSVRSIATMLSGSEVVCAEPGAAKAGTGVPEACGGVGTDREGLRGCGVEP